MKNYAIDYVEALKRPFLNSKSLAVGSILGIIPVVNFTVIGYTLSSTGLSKEKVGKDSLPEWSDYVDLFMKGLVSILIGIILFLPAALVMFATLGSVFLSPAMSMILGGLPIESCEDLMAGQIPDTVMEHWLAQNWTEFIPLLRNATPFLILAVLLGLAAFYIMPVAILGWLKEDDIKAAFNWNNLKMTMTLDYLVNWLIVGYLIGLVNSLFSWIPVLGVGITMYVGGVFSYTVYSELFERAEK
ncbi:MAG: DUF4013 domain-containing protein [Candidatus Bathyarchaeota archaeon]|nr:DUF4013 domain-containing protein [Candidatus Bathyarchaeota archaeon]